MPTVYDEFFKLREILDELSNKTKHGDFSVSVESGRIRSINCQCPLEFLTNWPKHSIYEALDSIYTKFDITPQDLDPNSSETRLRNTTNAIIGAADNPSKTELRIELEKACKIT